MRLFAFAGKFVLFLAAMAILTGISFFVLGAYVASWPIMRVSPRDRRVQAIIGLGVAVMAAVRAYGLDKTLATGDTEDTENTDEQSQQYPYIDGDTVVLGPECFISGGGEVLSWRGQDFHPGNLDNSARMTGAMFEGR